MVELPTPEHPWIVAPLTGATVAELARQADAAASAPVDAVEWRVDAFTGRFEELPDALAAVRTAARPVLTTVRTELTTWVGEYHALVRTVAGLGPELVDVEACAEDAAALVGAVRAAGAVPVVSRHPLGTPDDPARTLAGLRALAGPDGIVKLAVPGEDADLPTLAQAGLDAAAHGPVIVLAMGDEGRDTRLRPGAYGSCATFGVVTEASAPGQLPATEVARALNRA